MFFLNRNFNYLYMNKHIRKLAFAVAFASIVHLKAQAPIAFTGNWVGTSQTITVFNTGVGTTTPDGKMEVKYQPCVTQQNGLIVTSLGCTMGQQVYTYNPVLLDGIVAYTGGPNPPQPPLIPLTFSPAFSVTTSTIPLVTFNNKPMFWIRDENPPSSGFPGSLSVPSYNTKFIVMPNGHTGINTNNPRGTLDVVQFALANKNEPTAVFSKIVPGTQTQLIGGENGTTPAGVYGYRTAQVMVYNSLGSKSYNRIVQDKDQGILFTDGVNTDGSNSNGALVIAPWASDYTLATSTVGGIRIDKFGKVEIHGDLRATKLVINAKWWSDFVFSENYNLMTLDSVNQFIKCHGYLPGMPSEQEVLDSGLNISDMQALQQQKIEELTLYSIAQEEKIKAQAAAILAQENRLKALEAKLNEVITK
jgi:hypothetical protein